VANQLQWVWPFQQPSLFEFILKGFDALEYQEHMDYTIIRCTNPDFNKAIIRVNITRNNRQSVQYISPNDTHLLNAADLLIIDEAAAIPLPLVKAMLGPYLVFMASTITGRSLSLKLVSQIQKDNNAPSPVGWDTCELSICHRISLISFHFPD
jgi:N-acetyltransferase 10